MGLDFREGSKRRCEGVAVFEYDIESDDDRDPPGGGKPWMVLVTLWGGKVAALLVNRIWTGW